MQIIITGGAGFLGQRLAKVLLKSNLAFDSMILADIVLPPVPANDSRITALQVDLSEGHTARELVTERTGIVFHLAAIVSSHAEKEFDLGWRVNLDVTHRLLEACRHRKPDIRFVFASSLAVYGGNLPHVVDDTTAVTPASSYGAQKAMSELLVNDYSRKQFTDGRVLRLPTICVRPGKPNMAASSFVSSIIREPLSGERAVCPVHPSLALWLSSPDTVIRNIIHGSTLDATALGGWRTVNLPGIGVTVQGMLDALVRQCGKEILARIEFKPDASINAIVNSWPGALSNTRALQLGFTQDGPFDDFITQHRRDTQS